MRRLHPATIVVALLPRLQEAIRAALPVIVGAFASGNSQGHGELIAAGIGALTGIFAIGGYFTTRYDIEDDHVVLKTGWIFRKDRRIPLAQVQNVNLRQNVLERIFKVATVDVETAMGHGRDLKLSVLGIADAERFKEEIIHAAHLDETSPEKTEEPLISLNRHDLLWGALTENHTLQTFVVLFSGGGAGISLGLKYVSRFPPAGAAAATVGMLVLLFAAGWIWGAIGYYLKNGGFTVRRSENVFRISYGLLNKIQIAIRPSRIEFLRISTTLLQRQMGRTSMHVGTASSFGESGVLAPVALFVKQEAAYESAGGIIPGLDIAGLRWRPFAPIFYWSAVFRTLRLALILALGPIFATMYKGGVLAAVSWTFWGFVFVMLLATLTALFLARPENGYAITPEALVVRQGYFHQSISAMPIERMENMAISQPFWWRSRRAVRVYVQGMKQAVHVGAMPESSVDELTAYWNIKIEARENSRLYELLSKEEAGEPAIEPSLAE